MDYKRHYEKLIERGKNRTLDGYFENHHIIPRCLGGLDTQDNLVALTAEEHYVAHQLLVKMFPEHKGLIWAALMMAGNPIDKRSNNKTYGWLKNKYSNWITNGIKTKLLKEYDIIPLGWGRGRKKMLEVKV